MTTCQMCQPREGLVTFHYTLWNINVSLRQAPLHGYVILTPRDHKENWGEISAGEYKEYGELISKVEGILNKLTPLERLYSVTISEEVRHLHMHLIPRYKDMDIKGLDLIKLATQSQPISYSELDNPDYYKRLFKELNELKVG